MSSTANHIPCGQGGRTPPGGARSFNVTFFLVSGKSTHFFEKVRKKSIKKSGTTGSSVVKFHVSESSGARRKYMVSGKGNKAHLTQSWLKYSKKGYSGLRTYFTIA
jgi:hypothetical protein